MTVSYGHSVALPDILPKRRGYCFCVWNTDCSGMGESYLPGETLPALDTDLCLYAVWKKNRWWCHCPSPSTASFTALKLDSSNGNGLDGAEYTLCQNDWIVAAAVSDSYGRLTFSGLKPGVYLMSQSIVPSGYEADMVSHQLTVELDGTAMIDGYPAEGFLLYNTLKTDAHFMFYKTDVIDVRPLPGAVFTLSNGAGAVSDLDGIVDFGVPVPRTYTLSETETPVGYAPVQSSYTVVVDDEGTITVNGVPISEFRMDNARLRTEPPTIDTVLEGNFIVTGTGIPGAVVTVRFEDGAEAMVTVGADSQWFVFVPVGSTLGAGQIVRASQQEQGLDPSDEAAAIVLPRTRSF